MRVWTLAVVVGLGLAWPAAVLGQSATTESSRVMLAGHAGFAGAGSGKTVTGDGFELGATLSVQPFAAARRVSLDAVLSGFRDPRHSLGPELSKEMTAQQFALRTSYTFRRESTRARPYVFGGLAVIHVDYQSECVDCIFDMDPTTGTWISRGVVTEHIADTKAGFTLGGGLNIRVTRRWTLRSEYSSSSTTPGSGWNWGWLASRVGLGYRF